MNTNSLILSSSGLKNLVLNEENEFRFIFGKHELRINRILAEFLSPFVSRLHRSDPTLNSLDMNDILNKSISIGSINYAELFNEDTLFILNQLSNGYSVDINEKQNTKLRLISILLDNKELFNKLNEIFPIEINESNIDQRLSELLIFHYFAKSSKSLDYIRYIDFISSHFYSIDSHKLIRLPKSLLYSIISNKNLKIENEDSLLDFINEIFYIDDEEEEYDEGEEDDDLDIIDFYEKVEFVGLSEYKFSEFLEDFDSNNITIELWRKLSRCFYVNYQSSEIYLRKGRYVLSSHQNYTIEEYQYDGNVENCFQGVIHHLTEISGGNVSENGTVDVTSSSTHGKMQPKNVVNLENAKNYFQSQDQNNSWIKYDFKDRKVQPKHYTIRTRHDWGKGGGHLKNWVIEGSNTDKENDWKILDSRNDINSLDDQNALNTFNIQTKLEPNECFRYLRLRQTGVNSDNKFYLFISALEFFGSLYDIEN